MKEMISNTKRLGWRCHTPNLIHEIGDCNELGPVVPALRIFQTLLVQLSEVAIEIDNPKLNSMMVRLTLYSAGEPSNPDYNAKQIYEILELTEPPQGML